MGAAKRHELDWVDIWLHVAVAASAVGAFCAVSALVWGLGPLGPVAIAVNTIGWPLREALQRRLKSSIDWCRPWRWSARKHMEAWPPVAVGNGVGAVILWLV